METHEKAAVTAPLSESQRGVWIAHRLEPASHAFHECALWFVDGPFDVDAFERALRAVAVRQPAMRTRYVQDRGAAPHQEVDAEPRVAFERIAIAGSGEAQKAALDAAVGERTRRPFDLGAGAPIRWTILALGPGRHAILRVWHHIMGDGMSGPVIRKDLERAYALAIAGAPCELPPLRADFLAFSRWQADPARRDARQQHVAVWKARLHAATPLNLAADFHGPATRSLRGAIVAAHLPRASVDALSRVGRNAHVTPFVILLTAFATLMSRLSGDPDVVVGTAIGGRPSPEYNDVVGFFATVTPCRVDLAGAPDTKAAVARVRERVREAIQHYDAPMDAVVEALGIARDPSRHPFFRVGFGLRNKAIGLIDLPGCVVRRDEIELGHARFDITLTLSEGPDGTQAYWNYATDLFAPATIERMARMYTALVAAMAQDPEAPLDRLPMMDAPTRERVVAGSVGRATPLEADAIVHRRFAARAAARPEARAIGTLTYAALDAASSRLAAELRARGVGPERFVAVARERTADLAVAWLAVLKCGAAYVPIDTTLPDARLGHMLADAKVAHAIADDASAYKLQRDGIDVVRPDAEAAKIAAHAPVAPDVAIDPEAPAYAIYTSGSTGRPKGVVVPHRAIVSLVVDNDYAPLGPDDVVAQIAPPAFDASTFEVWGPLLNGASIAPIAKATAMSPRALAAALDKERVTTLFLTTALFDAVAREVPAAFASCRTVLFGGEAADARRVDAVLRAGAPGRLVHVYGPTETTTFATYHVVRDLDSRATTVPIGRAIARAEVFVLRDDGEPCAPGEPGEIAIGGHGVALGYLHPTEADASRFVVAPVGDLPPRRLYRTGDRARCDEDGTITFLGRRDDQVKVLGHRIELAEVEAAIARHPGVRAVACVLRGDASDTRRIVAYVVPANPAAAPPDDLRRSLRGLLPLAMLPTEIAWVPSLPLNASGKLDRKALPEVVAPKPGGAGILVAARDPLERDLILRWEKLLGRPVGVYDRFFEIGGSSLLAARMVDEYERDTGLLIPLTAMFTDDTIDALAKRIRYGSLAENAEVVALHAGGTRVPFVFVHGDYLGGGFHSHGLARLLGSDQPIYVVHPHGLDGGAVPETIEAMAADRLRALRELRPHGPYVVGGHCNGAFVAFELARQIRATGEPVEAVVIIDSPSPQRAGAPTSVGQTASGLPAVDRQADMAARLGRAMRSYRACPLDVPLVNIRCSDAKAARFDEGWASLGTQPELHVLPGDHVTLVMERGGEQFAAVVRGVIDRAMRVGA
ncbi:MAG TPA: amino acid adenylation domain-containing protein [Casimicrobiaceae bacterium]